MAKLIELQIAAKMLGLSPDELTEMRSRNEIPHDQIKYYPDLLREAGYHTSNFTKTDYNIGGRPDADCWDVMKVASAWRLRKPGQPFFAVVNFIWGMVGALITPMILSWTSSDSLGAIISIAGIGMLAGSLVMSAWGGPKRRVLGIFVCGAWLGFCMMLQRCSIS